jgi:hypothetical protein
VKDWLAGVLIRAGLVLASDRHALWFYRIQRLYWTSVEGRALIARLEGVTDESKSDE